MPESTPTLPGGRAFTEVELVFLRAMHRIEAKVDQMSSRQEQMAGKVDTLVDALAEDEPPDLDLEGNPAGIAREITQSLDPSDPK